MSEIDLEPDSKTIQALLTSKFCPEPSMLGLPETSASAATAFKQAKTVSDLERCFDIFKQISFRSQSKAESSTMGSSGLTPAKKNELS